jgi:predicted 2-oxoglutarate/Fe(II)-dependent dioxygenase YbiX
LIARWWRHAPAAVSAEECALLRRVAEAAGFEPIVEEGALDGPAGYRRTAGRRQRRAAVEHPGLAAAIWARVSHLLEGWPDPALGLNERLRFYAYDPGDAFPPHTDGAFLRPGERSRLTLIVYLNADFDGGETVLLPDGPTLAPTVGGALLFPHGWPHEGRPVRSGRKVVLRTDVMFAEEIP